MKFDGDGHGHSNGHSNGYSYGDGTALTTTDGDGWVIHILTAPAVRGSL